jgi:hypothetical protein
MIDIDKYTKEELITEWKQLRGSYFVVLGEDFKKFEKKYSTHPLFESVVKNFDKSFKEINQVAVKEIESLGI